MKRKELFAHMVSMGFDPTTGKLEAATRSGRVSFAPMGDDGSRIYNARHVRQFEVALRHPPRPGRKCRPRTEAK